MSFVPTAKYFLTKYKLIVELNFKMPLLKLEATMYLAQKRGKYDTLYVKG